MLVYDSEIQKAEVAEIANDVTGLANTLDSSGLIQHKHTDMSEAPAFIVADEHQCMQLGPLSAFSCCKQIQLRRCSS